MQLTNKQKTELETIEYFIPSWCKWPKITDRDIEVFFEWSERGLHKDKISDLKIDGLNALVQGKVWKGRHMQIYKESLLDGMGYVSFIDKTVPRSVIDFMKKELFKGIDANIIEEVYQNA